MATTAAAALLAAGGTACTAGQPGGRTVTVRLADGRLFSAAVDAESDQRQLILRWQRGGIVITRGFPWSQVAEASSGGVALSAAQLQEAVARARQAQAPPLAKVDSRGWLVLPRHPDTAEAATRASAQPAATAPPRRVQSLSIEASLASWGPGVAPVGLLLSVVPLDDHGEVVPVEGTIEVDLTAERVGADRPAYPFQPLGHWTQWVRAGDFGPNGATVKLPFEGVPPEFDPRLGAWGNVHARLSVPGQGVFEASQSTTRIRPYSPVRDRLEQATLSRYFPNETTADGRR